MHFPLLLLALLIPTALSIPNPLAAALDPRVQISGLPPPPCTNKLCPDAVKAREDIDPHNLKPRITAPGLPGPTCAPHRPCPDKVKRVEEPGRSNPPCVRGICPDEAGVKARVTEPGQPGPICVPGKPCPDGVKARGEHDRFPCGRPGYPCPPELSKRIVGPGQAAPSCVSGRPCPL